jgi:hypothetical protein
VNLCPYEAPGVHVEAELIGEDTDPDFGTPLSVYECPNGHRWSKPQFAWLVRSFHYNNQAIDVGERRRQFG